MSAFDKELRAAVGNERTTRNAPLAPLTTFKVGGAADWLVTLRSAPDVQRVVRLAHEHGMPVVNGPTKLRGRHLDSRDLRSGMALIAAALAADGESSIAPLETVERG